MELVAVGLSMLGGLGCLLAFLLGMIADEPAERGIWIFGISSFVVFMIGSMWGYTYVDERRERELQVEKRVCAEKEWVRPKFLDGYFASQGTIYTYRIDDINIKTRVKSDECYMIRSYNMDSAVNDAPTHQVLYLRKAE